MNKDERQVPPKLGLRIDPGKGRKKAHMREGFCDRQLGKGNARKLGGCLTRRNCCTKTEMIESFYVPPKR